MCTMELKANNQRAETEKGKNHTEDPTGNKRLFLRPPLSSKLPGSQDQKEIRR